MANQNSNQEKTEEPTLHKLEQARREGNVSISKEISSVVLMTVSIIAFLATGGYLYSRIESLFEHFLIHSAGALEDQQHALEVLQLAMKLGMEVMMPILFLLLATALVVNLLQTGGVFTSKSFTPKASKINPVNGIKRIFSLKGFAELVKGFLKLFVVSVVIYYTVRSDIDHFLGFILMPMNHAIGEAGSYILMFLTQILAALFILSIADMVYQRFQHRKDLRMTRQEVKDEMKNMEGDPQVKSWRKRFGLSLRRKKRLDHAVLSSDVVVTNPTHYAVALQYNPESHEAPVVLAKGQRLKALRIRELASQYGIPIVENKPVAQALYASAEEDQPIPADLYKAVAEILAYVYQLKDRHKL